jgi:uncharacterized membrane protein YfcA
MTSSTGAIAPPVSFRLAAGIGLAAGLLGGLFGVGGGLIVVPALLAFASMDRRRAHGTSLGSTLLIGLASVTTYLAHGNVDWAVAACLTVGSVVGAVIGTTLLHVVSKRVLVYVFVATVLVTSLRLFTTTESSGIEDLTPWTALLMVVVGLVAGVLAGLLGIGGGVIMVPAVVMVLGLPPALAKGTSAAVIVPTALIGSIRNRTNKNSDIRVAVIVGLFGAVTAVIGALISDRLSDATSNVLFALLLVVVAVTQLMTLRFRDSDGPGTPATPGRERLVDAELAARTEP